MIENLWDRLPSRSEAPGKWDRLGSRSDPVLSFGIRRVVGRTLLDADRVNPYRFAVFDLGQRSGVAFELPDNVYGAVGLLTEE